MRTLRGMLVAAAAIALAACTGPAGKDGQPCSVKDNTDGTKTLTCPDGTNVTIVNGTDGTNGQQGPDGQTGPQGPQGDAGSSCSATPIDGGVLVQCDDGTNAIIPNGAQGQVGINGVPGKFSLMIDSVATTTGADGGMTSTLTFSVSPAANVCPGGVCDDTLSSAVVGTKTFYAQEYNATNNTFDTARNFSFGNIHFKGFTADGNGAQYTATKAGASFAPESSSGAFVYAYVTGLAAAPAPTTGHYLLPSSVGSATKVFGTIGYASNAIVSGCERCHGAPYAKHGYRMANVAGLPSFVPCKVCHTDQRVGSDADWYMKADDPANYVAVLTPTGLPASYKAKYSYTANLMNDVHNSHAFEFNYPQSMSNCATCHAGKMASIATDSNFRPDVCKSCHVVNGPTPGVGNGGVENGRAPAMTAIWAAKGYTAFHQSLDLFAQNDGGLTATSCNTCHKAGGVGKTFAEIHPGYDPVIYATGADAGTKWADLIKTRIDSTSYDPATHLVTVNFSVSGAAANAIIKPTLVGALYGWDTKDFLVSGHSTISGARALEYTEGATNNSTRLTVNPSTTPAGTTSWTATADLSTWAANLPDGGVGYIPSGAVKRMQISVLPALGLNQGFAWGAQGDGGVNDMIAIAGATATITLVPTATLDAGMVDPTGYGQDIVDSSKCNACHDRLATTFHNPNYGSTGTLACRSCHWVGAGGSHLEMQSRSIDSYVHAIHRMQYFDIQNVDFTNPVQKLRYEDHVEGNYPNFAGPLNCESCHNPGKYDPPDQTRSLPSIISGSRTLMAGSTRNIGTFAAQVTGPAERACGGCHRAELINEDNAAGLSSFYAHTTVNGSSVMDTSATSLEATQYYIMGEVGVRAPAPAVPGAQVESCSICHAEQGQKHQQLFNSWKKGL